MKSEPILSSDVALIAEALRFFAEHSSVYEARRRIADELATMLDEMRGDGAVFFKLTARTSEHEQTEHGEIGQGA